MTNPLFTRAARQSLFLRYIVENCLDGRLEDLKEHSIGVSVYGRRADYDTREDPIVRVEAARLRAKLREYYESSGKSDQIRFELPKGTYTPRIQRARTGEPGVAPQKGQRAPLEIAAQTSAAGSPEVVTRQGAGQRRWVLWAAGVVVVVLAGTVWTLNRPRAAQDTEPKTIAVLPFQDLSEKRDQELFCEGLTDQLTDELSRVNGLLVSGRTSSDRFRQRDEDLRSIGQRLNVTHILEGSVRISGPRVRVTARLVDTRSGYQLWSTTLEKSEEDFFQLEGEIAQSLTRTLQLSLSSRKESPEAARSPRRLKSQKLFMEARALHRRMSPSSLGDARRLHEEAVEADQSYALAHSGLAHIYVSLMTTGLASPAELREPAWREARTAAELDPGLTDAYSAQIRLARDVDYDWSTAQRICQEASNMAPNTPSILVNCGILDMIQAKYGEAEEHFVQALRLDPLWPGAGEARANSLAWAGKLQEAEEQIRTVRSGHPEYVPALASLVRILTVQERHVEALDLLDRRASMGQELTPGQLALMAYVAAKSGNKARALEIERQLRVISQQERVLQSDLALVRTGLNDHAAAMEMLSQAIQNREPSMGETITDPLLAGLRHHPRFENLRRQMNLQ